MPDARYRAKLCSELMQLGQRYQTLPAISRAKSGPLMRARAMALRRTLTGRGTDAPGAELDALLVLEKRVAYFSEQINEANAMQPAQRAIHLRRLSALSIGLKQTFGRSPDIIWESPEQNLLLRAIQNDPAIGLVMPRFKEYGLYDPEVNELVAAGAIGAELSSELDRAMRESGATSPISLAVVDPALAQEVAKAAQANDANMQLLSTKEQTLRRLRTPEAQDAYKAAYDEYLQHYSNVYVPLMERGNAKVRAASVAINEGAGGVREVGEKILAKVIDASPIDAATAKQWADAQEITDAAVRRLAKIGYPVAQVRADMAEFYRLTGGRIARARLHSKGDRRANATDIGEHGKPGTIHLDTNFSKRTLWHELGHHIEADPAAKMVAGQMIRRRAKSAAPGKLRRITGNKTYGSKEIALENGFFSPYIGKLYNDACTEVFSMGLETFSNPVLLAHRMHKDPQTLAMVTGYVSRPVSDLEKQMVALQGLLVQASEEGEASLESQIRAVVEALAARAAIKKTDVPEFTGARDTRLEKLIGHIPSTRHWVFSGKVRDPITGRSKAGHYLVDAVDGWCSPVASRDMGLVSAIAYLHSRGIEASAWHFDEVNRVNQFKEALNG